MDGFFFLVDSLVRIIPKTCKEEAITDLVTDVNLDVSPQGISLQAMDTSHVALVSLFLSMEGFE